MPTTQDFFRLPSRFLLIPLMSLACIWSTGWGNEPLPATRISTLQSILPRVSEASLAFSDVETTTNSIGMKLVTIPAGEFMMGSAADDEHSREDEKPQHLVKISQPFLLGQYEVTQSQYEQVMGKNPSWFSTTGGGQKKVADLDTEQFPVENVSWNDAVEFCAKLSELPAEKAAGRSYRLPTEAEWQYACRAGTNTYFHFGDSLSSTQANINGRFPFGDAQRGPYLGRTTAVGSYEPNDFGVYDMHGNVAESCADWFGREYYSESPTDDPQGPADGSDRIVMGGSWSADAFRCRCAHRRSNATSGAAQYFGFRVVCEQE